jgi:hypothetical protein
MTAERQERAETGSRVRKAPRWVRVANLSVMTDIFLVAAVTTIVLTRSYLAAAGFPQVGGNGLHVSHMLWGGLLMTIALFVAILTFGRWTRVPIAVLGGIGFGLFVDEVGKFITSDNDYFFKPTFALIYVVLIGLYFLIKELLSPRPLKPYEYVLNAIDFLPEAALGRLTSAQKTRALYRLEAAGDEPMAAEIRALLESIEPVPSNHWLEAIRCWYRERRELPGTPTVLTLWFSLQIVLLLAEVVVVTLFVQNAWDAQDSDGLGRFAGDSVGLSAIMGITAVTTLLSIALTGIAIRRLRKQGLHPAYRAFENSLLLSIFVTQVLAFFESWAIAVVALLIAVPSWAFLRLLIDEEGGVEADAALAKR